MLVEGHVGQVDVWSIWQCSNVILGGATDVSDCILHQFDATLTVIGNYVASDVRLTVLAVHYDAVKGTLLNPVSPDQGH